ncbi:NAD(P)H-quinone oxidoreductase subunit N [Synechococcus sp. PCC 7336]|nr:NAD(P)H-quinone oxidoreductase subunit N [Synechococcus sp. PCC 7336]
MRQLSRQEPQVKFVVEIESDRVFRYQPLENLLKAIA